MSAFSILWNNKLVKQTSNRRKYCSSCWKDKKQEWNRENFKKWYYKQKSNTLENP